MNKNVKIIIGIFAAIFLFNMVNQFMAMRSAMPYMSSDIMFEMVTSALGGLAGLIIPIFIFWKVFGSMGKGLEKFKNMDLTKADTWKDIAKNLPQDMNAMATLSTQKNFVNLVSPEARNPDAVKTELEKFKKIKEIKEVDPANLDLKVTHKDDSEHLYRATIKGNKSNCQILSLSRYS